MNLSEEIERLARLRAEGSLTAEEFTQAKGLLLSGRGFSTVPARGIRRQSARTFCGLPLWAIAMGPDYERGETRGHARAIFAIGDLATGWFACGGLARGLVAVGGLAVGIVALVGGAIGVIALGGGAIGVVALGGGAGGYYALGGGAVGVHPVSSMEQDPAALDFFERIFPSLKHILQK